MPKQSKIVVLGKKNIKNLLEELTLRDIQSTQLKINQVINCQRANYRHARQLDSVTCAQRNSHKRHYLLEKKNQDKQKENQLHSTTISREQSQHFQRERKLSKPEVVKNRVQNEISTERYSDKRKQKNNSAMLRIDLPSIPLKHSKKFSFDHITETEQDSIRKTSTDSVNLAVIQEEVANEVYPDLSFSNKLLKQKSWGPTSTIE